MQVGEIDIQISIKQQQLLIKISDNFTVSKKENSHLNKKTTDSGHGLSLYNIEQRLQNQYAEQASFSSQALYPGWQTILSIPISQPNV